nr:hypothetical protein [Pseudarthrobacter sulfonivorans]
MYVGWRLIQLGAGTLAGSSWVLATLPAELLVEHRFVLGEEAMLAELFGRSHRDYAKKVPRYLGFPMRHCLNGEFSPSCRVCPSGRIRRDRAAPCGSPERSGIRRNFGKS